ncbi:MAG: hypothetical protein COA96_12140 [SAR86 cluster bacterium]|uniref:Uncharacterized protein n=1 Tax=SAR86 cluster bacterium TaxID=2030880 RepID=A0A2A5AVI3_9GAMM|nr:MAG: hypothetical protein COA96_12140 [SAR86 cluster bacterium]
MGNKLIYVIFAIVISMACILIAISFAEPVANAGGIAHPDIPGMRVGGDGIARLAHIGTLAFLFQSLLLLLVVCLCALGVAERHRSKELFLYFAGTFIFSILVWWQMYAGHQAFMESGTTSYFMGFPVATSWQVYGTWLSAIPLVFIYSMGFRKFIFTKEDEEKFNQLIAKQTSQTEQ